MDKNFSAYVDGNVLLKVSEGDKSAFQQLYYAYVSFINTAIKRYVAGDDECGELTQQVFITLWERREVLADVRNLQDYLFVVTRNKVFKYFSTLRKEALILKELQYAHSTDPQSIVLSTELQEYSLLWEKAVQLLPSQQKQVYVMIEQQEGSLDQAAKALGLARGTVKKHLELARKAVRKFISNQLDSGRSPKAVVPLAILSLFIF